MLSRRLTVLLPAMTIAFAACDREPIAGPSMSGIPASVPVNRAAATLDWQAQARTLVSAGRLSALASARVHAALSIAQRHAVTAVDPDNPATEPVEGGYGVGGRALYEARRGAIAGASAHVLAYLFPNAATALEQKVTETGESGPGMVHPEFTRGVEAGAAAAAYIIEHLQNDGFTRPWQGPAPTGPGVWTPNSLPPAGGTFGAVKPYTLTSGSQFRPAPPPAPGSAAFSADLSEVLTMTQQRTPEQLAIARSWDYAAGTPTPIGYWNQKAADYIVANRLDDYGATRVFGIMHTAVMDAMIGCWEAKYHYWTLRPYQASPSVSLALAAPNHPSYPSGHSCGSASAARVLSRFFPDRGAELNALVTEAGMSRIYAGIHYRFDITAGQELGRAVADWVMAKLEL